MTIKETLINFCKETKIYPPFTLTKIKKAGFEPKEWLINFKEKLAIADDIKPSDKTLHSFFAEIEKLIAD